MLQKLPKNTVFWRLDQLLEEKREWFQTKFAVFVGRSQTFIFRCETFDFSNISISFYTLKKYYTLIKGLESFIQRKLHCGASIV